MRHATHFPKKYLLAALIPVLMHQTAFAEDTTQDLGTLTVTADKLTKPQGKLGERTLTRKQLTEENIQDAHDLVRYNTEVDVAEVGRYGNKGFAVRGVDGNRVALSLDGVALPEVEVNELFSPYGYMYEGRFNPDLEMMGQVKITAGADSLISGSGAVGGSVSYRSKEPKDLAKDGLGGYVKTGYTDKNSEWLMAAGLAGRSEKFEWLLNASNRSAHELKNHDMRSFNQERLDNIEYFTGKDEQGRSSQPESSLYPDSLTRKRTALLAKAYYHLTDEHRLGVSLMNQRQHTHTFAFSQSVTGGLRQAYDQEELKGAGLNYRYSPKEGRLEELSADYQYQDIDALADTYKYTGLTGMRTLGSREYRPIQNTTHQLKLESRLAPIDLGKLGEHRLKMTVAARHQDFQSTAVGLTYSETKSEYIETLQDESGLYYAAIQNNIIPFVDAKKSFFNLTINDDIIVNDRLKVNAGARYDFYRYKPYFQNKTYFGDERSNETTEIAKHINNPNVKIKFYRDHRDGVYNNGIDFKKMTYAGGFDYKLTPEWSVRYKGGTGFLAPNINQMFSSFQGLGAQQLINPDLKAEKSINHELELEWNKDNKIAITGSVYRSDYKDFIHSVFWHYDSNVSKSERLGCAVGMTCIRSENLDEAYIQGIKLGIRGDLSRFVKYGKLIATADYHTSKDEARVVADQEQDGVLTVNTLAAVPANTILGLDYSYKNLSLHLKGKFTEAKRPEDTKYVETVQTRDANHPNGYLQKVSTYKNVERGKDTWIWDLYGSYKFKHNFTLQAGIYNLGNVKYIPWENLRQFGIVHALSPIDQETGYGFNRYTAPGRNFALSLTYEFQ